MSDLDHGRACLLITGAPGAGKSTVAGLVAQSLERSGLLNGDAVHGLVVGGRVWPLGQPAEEAVRQVRLGNANLCALAANLADAGFTPVVDWIIPDGEQLAQFADALADRPLLLVVLAPSTEACRHRDTTRPAAEQFAFDGHDALYASMRTGFGSLGWWFDTSELTAEETTHRILRDAAGRARLSR